MAKKKRTRAKAARSKKKTTGAKPAAAKKRRARKKTRRRSKLRSVSTAEIQREMERRERLLGRLQTKRDALAAQLEDVEAEIATLSGAKRGPGRPRKKAGRGPGRPRKRATRQASTRRKTTRKRPRNKSSLVESLKKTLRRKTMSVTEAVKAVRKAGYKTSSENFRAIVNQTLLGKKGDFKRVARGQYTAK